MRIVLVEPSHWHFEMYRPGIARSGAAVVGVVDRNPDLAARIGAGFGCPAWPDLGRLLDATQPDFAFAFGAHDRMPAIAQTLIARGIPFSLEKPGGIRAAAVHGLQAAARDAGLYVSVPFHYRLSSMARVLGSLGPLPSPGFRHFGFFINAGSPLRFADTSPWLVDPGAAGGGCMMNLAHHAIDFVLHCTGSRVTGLRAAIANDALGLAVEDAAQLHLTLANGATAAIQTGYTHAVRPEDYMGFHLEVAHADYAAVRMGDRLAVAARAAPPGAARARLPTDWQFKHYFAAYACDTLDRCRTGRPPVAGLGDLAATLEVVQAAYAAAMATPGLEALVRLHRAHPTSLTT